MLKIVEDLNPKTFSNLCTYDLAAVHKVPSKR